MFYSSGANAPSWSNLFTDNIPMLQHIIQVYPIANELNSRISFNRIYSDPSLAPVCKNVMKNKLNEILNASICPNKITKVMKS